MFEIIYKAWFLIAIMPLTVARKGYEILNKFLAKHGYPPLHWTYVALALLLVILVILLTNGYS